MDLFVWLTEAENDGFYWRPTESRERRLFIIYRFGLANASLPKKEHIHISAHVLRHTFLRKAARKYGVEYAKELAGHTSDRYIWRYVQPSDAEKEEAVDNLF